MQRTLSMRHEFHQFVPDELSDGVLYVSVEFRTAIHKCACGCGQEIVTPLSPTDWTVTFDGETVSLSPSIGNWSSPCRSHYWIVRDTIRWAESWTDERVMANRDVDALAKRRYYETREESSNREVAAAPPRPAVVPQRGFWGTVSRWLKW